MCTRYRIWTYLFLFSCLTAFAQQNDRPAPAPAEKESPHQARCSRTAKSGHVLSGLRQQDFTLLDNKEPQKIVSFRTVEGATATTDPVEVILLIDEVNTSFANVGMERQEIEKFLRQNSGELIRPVSIVLFSDSGSTIGTAPSRDGKALISIGFGVIASE